jgi:hypothetical protein
VYFFQGHPERFGGLKWARRMSDPTSFIGQSPGVEISQSYQVWNVVSNVLTASKGQKSFRQVVDNSWRLNFKMLQEVLQGFRPRYFLCRYLSIEQAWRSETWKLRNLTMTRLLKELK